MKINGKVEVAGEDLKAYVTAIATALGTTIDDNDIAQIYRIGKNIGHRNRTGGNRKRPIMVKFTTVAKRNDVYFTRNKLKGRRNFDSIYINDDVNERTWRQRADMRSVSQLLKAKKVDHKVHSGGIKIGDKKYRNDEPESLPDEYSIKKAKTLQKGSGIYFQSQYSELSNM